MEQNKLSIEGPAKQKLLELHDRVATYITKIDETMRDENTGKLAWATAEGAAIAELMKESRREHLARLQKEEVSPYFSLAYTDMLNFYRRMKDHALNIAEVVAGEK
jgi:phosphate:Na+ symporter